MAHNAWSMFHSRSPKLSPVFCFTGLCKLQPARPGAGYIFCDNAKTDVQLFLASLVYGMSKAVQTQKPCQGKIDHMAYGNQSNDPSWNSNPQTGTFPAQTHQHQHLQVCDFSKRLPQTKNNAKLSSDCGLLPDIARSSRALLWQQRAAASPGLWAIKVGD